MPEEPNGGAEVRRCGMLGILFALLLSVTTKTDTGDSGDDDGTDGGPSRHFEQEGSVIVSWSI